MNRIAIIIMIYCLVSCGNSDDNLSVNGCDLKTSELVFQGDFVPSDIIYVLLQESHQKSLFPVPDWSKSGASIKIEDPQFFHEIKESFVNSVPDKWEPELADGSITGCKSIHYYIKFRGGKAGCLFGSVHGRYFHVSPMFERDSYGVNCNMLYNKTISVIRARDGPQGQSLDLNVR